MIGGTVRWSYLGYGQEVDGDHQERKQAEYRIPCGISPLTTGMCLWILLGAMTCQRRVAEVRSMALGPTLRYCMER